MNKLTKWRNDLPKFMWSLEVNVGTKTEFIHTMSHSGVKFNSSIREDASNVCKGISCTSQEPEHFILVTTCCIWSIFFQARGSAWLMHKDGKKLREASGIHQIRVALGMRKGWQGTKARGGNGSQTHALIIQDISAVTSRCETSVT